MGSKGRKIVNFIKTERFDKEVINERGWDVTIDGKFNLSPRWSSAGNLVAKYRNKLKKKAETKAKKAAEKLKERRANIQY